MTEHLGKKVQDHKWYQRVGQPGTDDENKRITLISSLIFYSVHLQKQKTGDDNRKIIRQMYLEMARSTRS